MTLLQPGIQYGFPAGNVVSVLYRETPQGLRLTYSYDGSQRLQSVQEPSGCASRSIAGSLSSPGPDSM